MRSHLNSIAVCLMPSVFGNDELSINREPRQFLGLPYPLYYPAAVVDHQPLYPVRPLVAAAAVPFSNKPGELTIILYTVYYCYYLTMKRI